MTASPPDNEAIFHAARDIPDPDRRREYVTKACGADETRIAHVEALLAAADAPDSLLDRPAGSNDAATIDQPTAESPGALIGPYKLLEQIGEGGMGTVWMAEQKEPIQRRVAVKVIKAGTDSKQVLARFEAERQALALMDHPNIARVLDAGTIGSERDAPARAALVGASRSGRPYFVMELVKGTPITKYCDDKHLSVRERLELFGDVCRAVQHAHQKGIIHRDLKPSNILIAPFDGKPVVKVIDFGVAKATGRRLTEVTLFTGFGAVVGTPEYMSPEQAESNNQDIDTRSDIYSLGVLLYELLTGSTPLTPKRVKEAALLEVLRVIREEEPPRPSTRLCSTEELPSVAAQRHTEPAKLTKLVRGELDWIVMKALEKDRSRRYETANGFAMDVQRYLADEPVQACPPSARYRFRKFAQRHKVGLTVAGSVMFFLLLLGVGAGWIVRDRAAREAETERRGDIALQDAARLRDEKRWFEARSSAQRVDSLLPAGEGHADLRHRLRDLLTDLDMVDRLERIRIDQSMLGNDEWWDHVGADAAYEAAFREFGIDVPTLDRALAGERIQTSAIREQLVAGLDDWAWLIPRKNTARREQVRTVAGLADPDEWRARFRDPSVQRNRKVLEDLAARPEVATLPPSTVVLLGRALRDVGASSRAVEVLAAAQLRTPADFWLNVELAFLLRWHAEPRRYDEAAGYCRVALALRPDSVGVWVSLGNCLRTPAHLDEAVACYHKAIDLLPNYADAYNALGYAMSMKGDLTEAIRLYQHSLRLNPKAANVHINLARAHQQALDQAHAIAEMQEAIRLSPTHFRAQQELAFLLGTAKDPRHRDPARALEAANKAIKSAPKDGDCLLALGIARYRTKDWEGAIAALGEADKRWPSGNPYVWIFLSMAYWRHHDSELARATYDRAVRWIESRTQWIEGSRVVKEDLGRFCAEAAELLGIAPANSAAEESSPKKP
jgi:serine/threonine protein kinase/tetratricopeptide (TPR) repeat protein